MAGPPSADRGGVTSDVQLAALTAVAATLTQQIAVQTGAIAANTAALVNASRERPARGGDASRPAPPRPTVGPPVNPLAGLMAGGMSAIVSSIVAPLAPLAALAQTISATTSGFGTFLKMTQLITTSLAGLFLPTMLVAAGAAFAFAQQIQGPLLEAMGDQVGQMTALIETAAGLNDSFSDLMALTEALGGEFDITQSGLSQLNELLGVFGLTIRDAINFITAPTLAGVVGGLKSDKPNMLERATAPLMDMLFDAGVPGVPRYQPPEAGTAPTAPREGFLRPPDSDVEPRGFLRPPDSPEPATDGVGGFMAEMRRGMNLAIQSMRQEVGGPAQSGQDLSNVWRSATMAGLSVDPIQREQLDIMLRQLAAAEKMLAELEKREAQYK